MPWRCKRNSRAACRCSGETAERRRRGHSLTIDFDCVRRTSSARPASGKVGQRRWTARSRTRRFSAETEVVRNAIAATLMQDRRDAQRLAGQANPRLRLRRRLPFLADVPASQQAPRLRLDALHATSPRDAERRGDSPVGAQTEQPFLRRGQGVVHRGVQSGEVAAALAPGQLRPQIGPLPVEEMNRGGVAIDEKMIGVQIGMAEAGRVQSSQRGAEPAAR